MSDMRHSDGLQTRSANSARTNTRNAQAEWESSLNRHEQDAIGNWKKSWDTTHLVHQYERGEKVAPENEIFAAREDDDLHSALDRAPIQTATVYRGVGNLSEEQVKNKFKVGDTMTLDALQSFALRQNDAEEYADFGAGSSHNPELAKSQFPAARVVIAAKLPVVQLPRSEGTSEIEALAQRGTKMKITGIDETFVPEPRAPGGGRTHYHIHAEYAGGGWDESKHPRDENGKFTNG